jgi:hypothetical protein
MFLGTVAFFASSSVRHPRTASGNRKLNVGVGIALSFSFALFAYCFPPRCPDEILRFGDASSIHTIDFIEDECSGSSNDESFEPLDKRLFDSRRLSNLSIVKALGSRSK